MAMRDVWNKPLLSYGNPKTQKGEKVVSPEAPNGYLTGILHLAPHMLAKANVAPGRSVVNVCPAATPGCIAACLNTAGRGGVFPSIAKTRRDKTQALFRHRTRFLDKLASEIRNLVKRAALLRMVPAVRLNGTSDLPFLVDYIAPLFPTVQFYDYTKIPGPERRMARHPNYHVTFSWAETEANHKAAWDAITAGVNVAVVFETRKGEPLPAYFLGLPVVDGDAHDLRFLDPRSQPNMGPLAVLGRVIGLRAKGKAKSDTSGFVVRFREDAP